MIARLKPLTTPLSIIAEIPNKFFAEVETTPSFGDSLFPAWANTVFSPTALKTKFEAVFLKYKSIKSQKNRDKITNAFTQNNRIKDLCSLGPGTEVIELNDLPKSIRKEIDQLFLYLYNTAINYQGFTTHVNDTIKSSIDRFISDNQIEVCPLCGLEGFLNLDSQARIALDHWLCKDLFPFASVNFDNLFPIGSECNARPAKGSKNILIDSPATKNRIKAFYPYLTHNGITTLFSFINEPQIRGIVDTDWTFSFTPNQAAEQDIYASWVSTLNIGLRYKDYLRKNIFGMWEARYKRFIEKSALLQHAQNINELKVNFQHWKDTFDIKAVPGSIVYISFIDYLIDNASDRYLYGLCENFKRPN